MPPGLFAIFVRDFLRPLIQINKKMSTGV
jgi:hypothetical protein